jgi:phosphoribosylanthranilate isomerase
MVMERMEYRLSLIKICGLSREIDIEYANELKPDFIGFIFAESIRKISKNQALILKKRLDPSIKSVGVFVNADIFEVYDLCQNGVIDLIQLHGDEDSEYINSLKSMLPNPVVKAFRVGVRTQADKLTASSVLDENSTGYHEADYLMFDAFHKKLRGGGGLIFDWSLIGNISKPFFLAGGLNIDNIVEAIKQIKPYVVDVSSGAETDGLKDYHKMSLLIDIVKGGSKHDQ